MKHYYALIASQALSLIGSQMTQIAVGIWAYTETGNASPLLLVILFNMLPATLAGSLAGVIADRYPRRLLLIGSDAMQALPTLLLAISFFGGTFALWQLYLAAFVTGVFAVVQGPATVAATSMMVPPNKLDTANTLRQLSMPAAGLIAPVLTGFLYAFIDVGGIMLIDFATFLVAVTIVSRLNIPDPQKSPTNPNDTPSIWREVRVGFRFLQERPNLLILILMATFINFVMSPTIMLSTAYALALTGSEAWVGIVNAMISVGMLAGGIAFGVLGGFKNRVNTISAATLLMCGSLLFYGVARAPIALATAAFFLLIANPPLNASFASLLQMKTPPEMHGRVFAVVQQLATLAMPVGLFVTGVVVDFVMEPAVGTSGWQIVEPIVGSREGSGMGLLMVGAALLTLLALAIVYAIPSVRNTETILPDHTAAEPAENAPAPLAEPLAEGALPAS